MDTAIITDPRETAASLIVPIDAPAIVSEAEQTRRQRMKGEMHLGLAEPVIEGALQAVGFRRLGLYSIETPSEAHSGEISISTIRGDGGIELVANRGAGYWRLGMDITARVTYREIARVGERTSTQDYRVAPAETFRGIVTVELDAPLPAGSQYESRVRATTVELHRSGKGVGTVSSISLKSAVAAPQQRAVFLSREAQPLMVLPLVPVRFPLGDRKLTGKSWDDQLCRANQVWGKCGIRFDWDSYVDVESTTRSPTEVLEAHLDEEAIEIFLVADENMGNQTDAAGDAFAAVILSELNPQDPYILAHELGHVLGLCHPDGKDCEDWLCPGELGTVLEPKPEIDPSNSDHNCIRARHVAQPLLEALKSKSDLSGTTLT